MIIGNFQGKIGLISVQIGASGGKTPTPGLPSTDMEIVSLGSLSLNIDVTPDGVSIDSLQTASQKMKISVMQYSLSGIDIHDALRNAITTASNNKIDALLRITKHDDTVYDFPMEIANGDFAVNDFSQLVDITLTSIRNEDITMLNVFTAIGLDQNTSTNNFKRKDISNTEQTYQCVGVLTFAKFAMREIFGNTFDLVSQVEGNYFTDTSVLETPKNESVLGFVILNYANQFAKFITKEATGRIATNTSSNVVKGGFFNIFTNTNNWSRVINQGGSQVRASIPPTAFNTEVAINDRIYLFNNVANEIGKVVSIQSDIELTLESNSNIATNIITGIFQELNVGTVFEFDVPVEFELFTKEEWRNTPALNVLKSIAAGSGVFFGSAFSKNHFIMRNAQTDQNDVELTLDDLTSLRYQFRVDYLNSIFLRSLSDNSVDGEEQFGNIEFNNAFVRKVPNLVKTGRFLPINTNAEKDLAIDIGIGYPFMNKGLFAGLEPFGTATSMDILNNGSGYTPGSYTNVILKRKSGSQPPSADPNEIIPFSYPTIDINVAGNGEIDGIVINDAGNGLRDSEDLIPNLVLEIDNDNAPTGLKDKSPGGFECGIKTISTPQAGFWDGDYEFNESDQTIEFEMLRNAALSYRKALTNPSYIEFTVIGSDKIKPFNTIIFDNTVPDKFQNRRFRPTTINYDFANDTATIKAYEIGEFESPLRPVDEFIQGVTNDGGTIEFMPLVDEMFINFSDANLICPCSTGKSGKLYFWKQ